MNEYLFYIDESCHLENDGFPVMCIGVIKIPANKRQEYKEAIKSIKKKYGILHEVKWNTIGSTHIQMYKELIDYFFNSEMEFRAILITNKDRLRSHSFKDGDYDNFYYRLIYQLLYNPYIDCNNNEQSYNKVYLDIKDTRGRAKLDKIHQAFSVQFKNNSPFKHFQHIRSHESQFIQLTDIFIGAITYKSRGLDSSSAKNKIVDYLELKSGYTLNEGTMPAERKFNILNHQPRKK